MKSIAVIGLGQFGTQIATSLTQKGFYVIALDNDVEAVTELKDLVSQAIILDSTDEKAMYGANIDKVDKAIVAIGSNMQSSLLTTALLQQMDVQEVYVRAINSLQENILKSMGITSIINIEKEMGIQVANILTSDSVGRYIEISNKHSLLEIMVPKSFVGKCLKDLNFRSKYRINIVGIKTKEPVIDGDGDVSYVVNMTDVPDPGYPLSKDDVLVIAGTDEHLNKFLRSGTEDE